MYCSHCGQPLQAGQQLCTQCGLDAGPKISAIPGLAFEAQAHAGKVRALAICWFVYAGLAVLTGIIGMSFTRLFLMGPFGPWFHPGHPMPLPLPAVLHLIWISIVFRAVLALIAGWGLWEHTGWGRIVAIVSAILGLIKFPLGTLLGIWTLVVLLGYRNSRLYERKQQSDPGAA